MAKVKKSLKIAAIVFLVLLILPTAAIFIIYKNQRSITQQIIQTLNEGFEGSLAVRDSYIAPFDNFPYISIDLQDVVFFGDKETRMDTIYYVKDTYVGFRVWDILKGEMIVSSIKLSEGQLNLYKGEDGKINLLTAKGLTEEEDEVSEDQESFLNLKSILLSNVAIRFDDQNSRTSLFFHIDDANSGFEIDQNIIKSNFKSDLLMDLILDDQPTFFSNKYLKLDFQLEYDLDQSILSLKRSNLTVEEALLSVFGRADIDNDWDLNIEINGEKPDFNLIAAFLPEETGAYIKRYKNEGDVYFKGNIKGKSVNGNTPAVAVEFGCDNAYFLNPEREKIVEDLRFSAFFTNGAERNLNTSEFQLLNFNARPEKGRFQGKLIVRDFTNPYIDINLNADLDLGFLGDFFEIEGLQGISGQVIVDMNFNELVDLEVQGVSGVEGSVKSELIVKNLYFDLPDFPHQIKNANVNASLVKGDLFLDRASFQIANSDFNLKGKVVNFPAVFHGEDKRVKADLSASSQLIDLEQLMVHDSTAWKEVISDFEIKLAFESTGKELQDFQYLPKGEFFIEDFHAKLKNYPHAFHDFHADILINEEDLAVIDFSGEIDKTDFHFSGKLRNYSKWFQEYPRGTSRFDFDLKSDHLAIHDLLTYAGENYLPEAYREEEIDRLRLSGNVTLVYDSAFQSADLFLDHLEGRMKLHPLRLNDFKGKVHYEDDLISIENFKGRMGDSDFTVDMVYYLGEKPDSDRPKNHFSLISSRLDLDALMGFDGFEKETNHEEAFNIFELPFSEMDFHAQIGKMNYHRYWLDDVKIKARTTPDHFIYLDTLGFKVASGSLGIKGYFNGSNPEEIYFFSDMEADRLDLDKLLFKFENFGQDYLINENLHGLVSGKIKSKFLVYPDLTPIIEKSEAKMELTVYDGRLVNFTPLQAMGEYFKDRNLRNVRFDTLSNTFELKEGILNIPRMNINTSLGFIELSGKQSLDLNMDYFIRIPLGLVTQVGVRSLFGGKNPQEIDPEQDDAIVFRNNDRRVRFVNVRMQGTPDDYQIGLGRDRERR